MKGRARGIAAVAALVVLAVLTYGRMYQGPRDRLLAELARHDDAIERYEAALEDRQRVREEFRKIAGTTLAASPDRLEDRLRSGLNDIAVECGLSGVQVGSGKPRGVLNPVVSARLRSTGLARQLRRQPGFSVVHGTVKGTGTLDQVLRTVATVQAQGWVHRVENLTIRPENKDRDRFELSIGVATLLMPDAAPDDGPEPVRIALDERAGAAWEAILRKSIFKVQPVAERPPAPREPRPAGPPYADWRLTGLVESRLGVEAFVENIRSGQKLTLSPGAAVADARLVRGGGEMAVFEIDGKLYEVMNGQTLEQRRPTN